MRRGDPIPCLGLTLYPIKMSHYEQFIRCRDALTLRIGTLPVRYLSLDFLSAIFALEIDRLKDGERVGLVERVLRLFTLSLGIERDVDSLESLIAVKEENGLIVPSKLCVTQDGKAVELSSFEFSSVIRPILAEQNGLVLPSEEDNADIIRAAEQKHSISDRELRLRHDVGDLISSVAYLSGVREVDISEWSVREFESRRRAIDRDKRYMLYAAAELSGMVSFKNGNPAVSWCFDAMDDSLGTMQTSTLEKTLSGVVSQ